MADSESADGLATTALVLAVGSFVVQLLVYVAQQSRNEQLYSDSRALLSRLEATAAGTQQLVEKQFDRVLRVVLEESSEVAKEAEGTGFDPDEHERRVMARVEDRLRTERPLFTTPATIATDLQAINWEPFSMGKSRVYFPATLKPQPTGSPPPETKSEADSPDDE